MQYQIRTIRHNSPVRIGDAESIYQLFVLLEEDRGANLFAIYGQNASGEFTEKIEKHELEKIANKETTVIENWQANEIDEDVENF
jgi:hypothetical protein